MEFDTVRRIASAPNSRCRISTDQDFETLWQLPDFPMTEAIGPFDPGFPSYDLELRISLPTGHVQAFSKSTTSELYSAADYRYRTKSSASHGLGGRATKFVNFAMKSLKGRKWNCLVDIGGNDLDVARQLKAMARSTYVIDPVCAADDGRTIDGVNVVGARVEDVDFSILEGKPDVIVMRHTLEHIDDPLRVLKMLESVIEDKSLLLIEVPDFGLAVESLRLETVFHQHVNYFDGWSLNYLLSCVGFRVIAEEPFVRGPSGGSVLVAAVRDRTAAVSFRGRPDLETFISNVKKSIFHFQRSFESAGYALSGCREPIFGYGASLMLPAIAYHIGDEFARIDTVIDDDEGKAGMSYRNLNVRVISSKSMVLPSDSSILITSFESERAIRAAVLKLEPRRIIGPQIC